MYMIMKTKFYGLFLAVMSAMIWTGCSDDDDDIVDILGLFKK